MHRNVMYRERGRKKRRDEERESEFGPFAVCWSHLRRSTQSLSLSLSLTLVSRRRVPLSHENTLHVHSEEEFS